MENTPYVVPVPPKIGHNRTRETIVAEYDFQEMSDEECETAFLELLLIALTLDNLDIQDIKDVQDFQDIQDNLEDPEEKDEEHDYHNTDEFDMYGERDDSIGIGTFDHDVIEHV